VATHFARVKRSYDGLCVICFWVIGCALSFGSWALALGICSSYWICNSDSTCYKDSLFCANSFFCFFFASSSLYFFPSTLAPHHRILVLHTTALNDERRVTLSFSPSCSSLTYHDLPRLTFASCIIARFFLRRSTGMATDTGSLAYLISFWLSYE
jgi:hypothetical protein